MIQANNKTQLKCHPLLEVDKDGLHITIDFGDGDSDNFVVPLADKVTNDLREAFKFINKKVSNMLPPASETEQTWVDATIKSIHNTINQMTDESPDYYMFGHESLSESSNLMKRLIIVASKIKHNGYEVYSAQQKDASSIEYKLRKV